MTLTSLGPLERRTRRAAIGVWLADAFAVATVRPRSMRAPKGRVDVWVTGEVRGGQFHPLSARGLDQTVRAVEHPDGIYSFSDQRLSPGVYRLEITTELYRPVAPIDVAVPATDPADPVALVPAPVAGTWAPLPLEPLSHYPFPREATLLRGELRWPDGQGIEGATVTAAGVSLNTDTVGQDGAWVLYFPFSQPTQTATLTIAYPAPGGLTPDQQVVLPSLPTALPNVQLQRGQSRSVPSTKLRGRVLSDTGLPVGNADAAVDGIAISARSDKNGLFTFYFPLDQADGTVTLRVTHPTGPQVVHSGVSVLNGRTSMAPDTVFSV